MTILRAALFQMTSGIDPAANAAAIVEMAGRGVIRGVIHQTFPLEDAVKAHEVMEGLSFFGKLVLTVP